ncbi:hypothetical protein [Pseudomonas atagonensis]|uniref:hypothetical protein n=1 Tax=Pseudomonas atagonensis TaxID=2609964 RepID=UPI00140C9AA9|nr:hypothetical protein [Pseudomonas atagonensis]
MTKPNESPNTAQSIPDCVPPVKNDTTNETGNRSSQKRSFIDESAADKKHGSGGLDTLGGGRLP